MPLTGLVAEARKRTSLMSREVQETRTNPMQIKQEVKRTLDFSSEIEQAGKKEQFHWQECKHLKSAGERKFCKRYFALCAQEKCNSKYINEDEPEIDFKRLLRGK